MMNYPNKQEFAEFFLATGESNHPKNYHDANKIFNRVTKRFPTPEDFIWQEDTEFRRANMRLFIYMCLKCRLTVPVNYLRNSYVNFADKIVGYFNLANNDLLDAILKELPDNERTKRKLFRNIIHLCICTEYKLLDALSLHSVERLKNSDFSCERDILTFLNSLERAIRPVKLPGMYTQPAKPDEKVFGTSAPQLIELTKKYLQEEYEIQGYQTSHPRGCIKAFLLYVTVQNADVNTFREISQNGYWEHYKKSVEGSSMAAGTMKKHINQTINLYEWLYRNEFITENELLEEYGYSWKPNKTGINDNKPKMFKTRDHYIAIFVALLNFKPKDDLDVLCKHFFLVITAIGARLSEVLWLTPNSVGDIREGVGEVSFKINEKLGLRNKPMSCYSWGLDSIRLLEERWKDGPKIKFFHKKSGKEFYTLFGYKRRVVSRQNLYDFFDKLMEIADIRDENGNRVEYKNIKFHAFRHQKFNDIYEVTNGRLSAVQDESNHLSLRMTKVYTQQDLSNRRITVLKAIEEGKIVGKGLELLNALLKSPFTPEQYLNVVQKMNFSARITKELIMEAVKDLGFGFCTNPACKIALMCEACDYYFTCKEQLEELKERYVNNFLLIQKTIALIGFDAFFKKREYEHLITGLKHQERWLRELGETDDEIFELKMQICQGVNNDSTISIN